MTNRPIPGAELFLSESLMNAFAEIGDEAYDVAKAVCGSIVGSRHEDGRGTWTEAVGLSYELPLEDAVGWFRSREGGGIEMSEDDVRKHVSLFGKERAYAVMIDPSMSSLAIFTVEDGVPVKPRAAVMEGR